MKHILYVIFIKLLIIIVLSIVASLLKYFSMAAAVIEDLNHLWPDYNLIMDVVAIHKAKELYQKHAIKLANGY